MYYETIMNTVEGFMQIIYDIPRDISEWFDGLNPISCLKFYLAIWVLSAIAIGGWPMAIYFAVHFCVTFNMWYHFEKV